MQSIARSLRYQRTAYNYNIVEIILISINSCQGLHCLHKLLELTRRGRVSVMFRSRHKDLEKYFSKESELVACSDVDGLMTALGLKHTPQD